MHVHVDLICSKSSFRQKPAPVLQIWLNGSYDACDTHADNISATRATAIAATASALVAEELLVLSNPCLIATGNRGGQTAVAKRERNTNRRFTCSSLSCVGRLWEVRPSY